MIWLLLAQVVRLAERGAKSMAALALVIWAALALPAAAHQMSPAVADAEVTEDHLRLTFIVQGEAMVAGVDLGSITDTNDSPMADAYDDMRALTPRDFAERFRADWPLIAPRLNLMAGDTPLAPELDSVNTTEAMADSLPRQTRVVVTATLPEGDSPVTVAGILSSGR